MADVGKAKIKMPSSVNAGDVVSVKAMVRHPMETGNRKDKKTGEKIPAHYIEDVTAVFNGTQVFAAKWGAAVSQDPFLEFYLKVDKPGDLTLTWKDNKGGVFTKSASVKVK
ncbi:sulfur compound chelating protein SoxZ [Magnetococcus marinus MC-1]|uniref:Sulfur compound chelating protein SoxZ n=1 Tax=Magnetococcus marinus (strain ATCC BAA-1437 / JCM 17883 / MC-1) TaxID=156889 RepID=A0L8X2_MAGMM|nr:thiosulfate oxidation carrier complex protein SoxZ [Magnetococcus marinus]ABK44415.1 sulfur compound chelating protein SoxZ [Magnetococcus marinus MC-1]ABK46200.1 sulfur compound chelating protein SoxZ [Magnetococcus marinus MC-1]